MEIPRTIASKGLCHNGTWTLIFIDTLLLSRGQMYLYKKNLNTVIQRGSMYEFPNEKIKMTRGS